MDFSLGYTPHRGQLSFHAARNYRFRVACCGRRWGKTLCLAGELLDRGGGEAAGDYGWIAPTYQVGERGIEAFRKIAEGFVTITGRAPARVDFTGEKGPVRVWFLSADNPDTIRGFGFQGIVVDEAAIIPVDVWDYVLRPTIGQTLGWAALISTPKGRNWFFDMYTRGLDGSHPDYRSFRFPSNASPFFPAREWEDAKRTMPADVFRQEMESEFLEQGAGVFRNVDACVRDDPGTCKHKGPFLVGVDLAKHTDFTVLLAVCNDCGRGVDMERFNLLDWPAQKQRIAAFVRRRPSSALMDSTGLGDPIFDDLTAAGLSVQGYRFTAESKTRLIQALMVAIEQGQVSWPAGAPWDTLTNELKRYEYEILPGGGIRYNAPEGYHDDCVIALALANHQRGLYIRPTLHSVDPEDASYSPILDESLWS